MNIDYMNRYGANVAGSEYCGEHGYIDFADEQLYAAGQQDFYGGTHDFAALSPTVMYPPGTVPGENFSIYPNAIPPPNMPPNIPRVW